MSNRNNYFFNFSSGGNSQQCLFFIILSLFILNLPSTLEARSSTIDQPQVYIDAAVKDLQIEYQPTDTQVLHLLSHGKSGALLLEGEWKNPSQIADWLLQKQILENKSHLQIYGCEFAKDTKGKAAVQYLESVLGITVAASDDITGIGGDWELEVGFTKNILKIPNYTHNLQIEICANGIDDDSDGIVDIDCECVTTELIGVSQTNTGVTNPANALGVADLAYADIRQNDDITIDLGMVMTSGSIEIHITRGTSDGRVGIEGSLSATSGFSGEIIWGNPTGFNVSAPATQAAGDWEMYAYTVPSSGMRYIRFDRKSGQIRVDAVRYCSPPPEAFAMQPSCINGVAQSDGYLQLMSYFAGDKLNFSAGSTYMGPTDYSDASHLTIGALPFQFGTGLSNANSGDITIRVFNGATDNYSDVTVTLETQDCVEACECTEYLYVNEPNGSQTGKVHKFEISKTDGSLTEIFNSGRPWYPGVSGNTDFNSPHGLASDINGFLYISEANFAGSANPNPSIRKLDCDGNIFPESDFDIPTSSVTNLGSQGPYLFDQDGKVYDLCTATLLFDSPCAVDANGDIIALGGGTDPFAWGMGLGSDGYIYSYSNQDNGYIFKYTLEELMNTDQTTGNCITPFITGTAAQPLAINANNSVLGIDVDSNGSVFYVDGIFGGAARICKYDANGSYVTCTLVDDDNAPGTGANGITDAGWFGAAGLIYSEDCNCLYTANNTDTDDCVSMFDVNLNYLGAAVGPVGGDPSNNTESIKSKAMAINQECCPTNNNVTVDTALCVTHGDKIYLQELFPCEGIICEGTWTPDVGNTGLSYNTCDNSVQLDPSVTESCGSFVLEASGYGNNPRCGAFIITININVTAQPEAKIFAIQPSCTNGTVNSDGYLQISEITSGNRFNWSTGSTYSGDPLYANATDTTGLTFPHIFTTGISNPSGSQDYTIRIFNGGLTCGETCYSDYTVTMKEQDCMVGCNCEEYIYLNETSNGGKVHKYSVAADGTLSEILVNNDAWYPGGGTSELPSPHGLGMDQNGYLYIGETASGGIRRLTCDGAIVPSSEFEINSGGFNIASVGDYIFTNPPGNPDGYGTGQIRQYDVCTNQLVGVACGNQISNTSYPDDWGFYYDSKTGYFYTTGPVTLGSAGLHTVHRFTINDFLDPATATSADCTIPPLIPGSNYYSRLAGNPDGPPVADVNVGDNMLPEGDIRGITTDTAGNIYIILQDGPSAQGYPSRSSRLLKYDANGDFLAATAWDITDSSTDLEGLWFSMTVLYSETSNTLFISRGDPLSNCIQEFDTNLNDLGGAVPPGGDAETAKAMAIVDQCCPNNNNVTIDSTLCAASINDIISLRELIGCDGPICGGFWNAAISNTGLTYDACNNTLTIDAIPACGTFTLESDGIGTPCGAFLFTVNIEVINNPTVTLIPDSTICTGETIMLYGILDSAGDPTYQWQSSTASCTTGFNNISGATDSTYTVTPMDTTHYRLITATTSNCASGNCADTSACMTVYPTDAPMATVADVLKCTSNSETIEVVPTGGTGPYTYTWSGPFITNPGNTPNFTASSPGTYTVTVTDTDGCTITTSGEMTFQSKVCLPATFTIKRGRRN